MGVKLKLLIFCILLASSVYMAGGYAIKGGEIHLVRPESPYIDSSHIPPEYLSNEDLVFYTCIEETDVPDHKRQAAITENGSFVAGMKRYFDLIWEYESFE